MCSFLDVKAQDENLKDLKDKSSYFHLSFFHVFTNTFQLNYEKEVNGKNLSFSVGAIMKRGDNYYNEKKGGVNAEFAYKMILFDREDVTQKTWVKSYFAPFLQYKYVEVGYNDYEYVYTYYYNSARILTRKKDYLHSGAVGITIGAKVIIMDKLCFDFYIGSGIRLSEVSGERDYVKSYNILDDGYSGVTPKIGLMIGMKL